MLVYIRPTKLHVLIALATGFLALLPTRAVAVTITDFCPAYGAFGTGVQGLGTTSLTITANSNLNVYNGTTIGPLITCLDSVVADLITSGPVQSGFLQVSVTGAADGDGPGGFFANASLVTPGEGSFSTFCNETACVPDSETIPFTLGVPFTLTANAQASDGAPALGFTVGGSGEIILTIQAYCLDCDPINGLNLAQDFQTFAEVPEPTTTVMVSLGGAILLMGARRRHPRQ